MAACRPMWAGIARPSTWLQATKANRCGWISTESIGTPASGSTEKLLGRHKSGYIGVRYDISDAVNYGSKNTLAVRCDARAQEGWWYEGGGIYRHVWLTKADKIHAVPDGTAVFPVVRADKGADVLAKSRSPTRRAANSISECAYNTKRARSNDFQRHFRTAH